jgi:hypothetical protein
MRISIFLAVAADIEAVSGACFAQCKPTGSSATARDDAVAEKLWTVSARLTGLAR